MTRRTAFPLVPLLAVGLLAVGCSSDLAPEPAPVAPDPSPDAVAARPADPPPVEPVENEPSADQPDGLAPIEPETERPEPVRPEPELETAAASSPVEPVATAFSEEAAAEAETAEVPSADFAATAPPANADRAADPDAELAPQKLLALLHAPEVHRELALTADQVRGLEELFAEIDGPWFRSRLLPADKGREVITELESRVHRWFSEQASAVQRQRLGQLEYQAQGTRSLLREDLSRRLRLTESQRRQLAERARATDAAQRRLQAAQLRGKATEELAAEALAAAKMEYDGLNDVVRPEQRQELRAALGESFDVSALERIYPTAPEFVPAKHWLNSEPLRLRQLRGKVVLVHFYAFQCHNCHANFEHYRRWHEKYDDEDVVVIGIQTPETSRERDPEAVRAAAEARGFAFPVLVDLESKNWEAWGNTMWPTVYVVDQDGYLRHWWQGELNWQGATVDQTIENLVDRLLKEKEAASDS